MNSKQVFKGFQIKMNVTITMLKYTSNQDTHSRPRRKPDQFVFHFHCAQFSFRMQLYILKVEGGRTENIILDLKKRGELSTEANKA